MRETIIPGIAITAIMVLEIVALINHIDGTLMAASFAVIGGLGGYTTKKLKDKIL